MTKFPKRPRLTNRPQFPAFAPNMTLLARKWSNSRTKMAQHHAEVGKVALKPAKLAVNWPKSRARTHPPPYLLAPTWGRARRKAGAVGHPHHPAKRRMKRKGERTPAVAWRMIRRSPQELARLKRRSGHLG